MESIGFGTDLSHFQDPATVPWDELKVCADFVICRASYGGGLRDRAVVEHVRRARQTGVKVGLYQFYRPSQTVDAHFSMFQAVAEAVSLTDGDIIPVIDIEPDVVVPPTPDWNLQLHELAGRLKAAWGGVMLYISKKDWILLGRPLWILECPIWVAHYTNAIDPATPAGRKPHIWQYRVGPLDPEAPGGSFKPAKYDHDRLIQPIPIIGESTVIDPITDDERAAAMGLVALTESEELEGLDERASRRCA